MRFLIVKTSAFGDVVQSFCVLRYLKDRHPDCKIDWVVEKKIAPLVRAHPLVDRVIEINAKKWKRAWWKPSSWWGCFSFIRDLRKTHYDAIFDLQGNLKAGLIDFFSRTEVRVGFGWKTAPERINCCFTSHRSNPPRGQNIRRDCLFVVQNYFKDFSQSPCEVIDFILTEDEKQHVAQFAEKIGPKAWMVCPGSAWKNKKLPEEKLVTFCELAAKTYGSDISKLFFIWGNDEERRGVERLSSLIPNSCVADAFTLPELQQLMKKSSLIVSMDSFPLSLAGTTGTPTFSFFGASISFKYKPLGDNHFAFQGSCPYGVTFDKRCPRLRTCATAACMADQDMVSVFQQFHRWWTQRDPSKIA